jgi:hypothetical protein
MPVLADEGGGLTFDRSKSASGPDMMSVRGLLLSTREFRRQDCPQDAG